MNTSLHIAVIGAGMAGRTFAAACAAAGHQVTLEDVMPHKLRNAEDLFASLGHSVELVQTVEDAVREADVAIDFVPDELESKLEIFSMLDRMAPPRTILLTPSDALSVTDLASCTYRPDRIVMMRGGSPTLLLTTRHTTKETIATVEAFLSSLGRSVITESDPDLPQLIRNMNLPAGSQL